MASHSAVQDAVLPVEFPLRSTSGAELRAVHVPAGTTVAISILAANYNKAVWGDDADRWDPERFVRLKNDNAEKQVKVGVYANL